MEYWFLFYMILVYVVCKDKEEANTIGKSLVKEGAVACANTFPIKSTPYLFGSDAYKLKH